MNEFLASLKKAVALHQAGRLEEAQPIYERLLARDPNHPDALNLRGLLAYEQGDHDQAIAFISKAVSLMPGNPNFHNNLGSVFASAAKFDRAVEHLGKATSINPTFSVAFENLGNALMQLDRADEAVAPYTRFVELEPDIEDGHVHLARALNKSGRPREAIDCLRHALEIDDRFAVINNNLGTFLQGSAKTDEAISFYRRAVEIDPGYAAAYANLASALWERNQLDEAERVARKALALSPRLQMAQTVLGLVLLASGDTQAASDAILMPTRRFREEGNGTVSYDDAFNLINSYKIEHDTEQLQYLRGLGYLRDKAEILLAEYQQIRDRIPNDGTIVQVSDLEPRPGRQFLKSYNRLVNQYSAPAIEGGALNPSLDTAAIQEAYHANPSGFAMVDELLRPEALTELRRFCLESTIWYDVSAVGDLGASLEEGFCCPLLLQIAEEIREKFPSIYGEHYFSTCWSYRYYAQKSGDDLHGDSGRVSVNIWLTPDEANLDPDGGGLLFWNKKVPMLDVKDNPKEMTLQIMRDIIGAPDAESFKVPYRCNRGTLFNSNTIHKTDLLNFKSGYLNRRMNITFVFGKPEY
ncbi:MAG: tetratricopeptide repeat protein [Rhodospirillales bacterium]